MRFEDSSCVRHTMPRRWSTALILWLTFLAPIVLLVRPVWGQGTVHSITVAVVNYTQGSDLATGINFYRATTSGGPYTKLNAAPVALAAGGAQFVDSTGVGGTKYFYVATAVDAQGSESASGPEASATFLSSPATPPVVTLTAK